MNSRLTLETIKTGLAEVGLEWDPGAALEVLGTTRDQIALNLIDLGVRGVRGEPTACVFVNYLKGLGFEDVYLGDSSNEEDHPEYAVSTSNGYYWLTDAQTDLVVGFDRGTFVELEEVRRADCDA